MKRIIFKCDTCECQTTLVGDEHKVYCEVCGNLLRRICTEEDYEERGL